MGRILRDVSERTLIVQGADEVDRIEGTTDRRRYIFSSRFLYDDVYEVKIIRRVGSYYPRSKQNGKRVR